MVLSTDFRISFPLNETDSHLLSYCFRISGQITAVLQKSTLKSQRLGTSSDSATQLSVNGYINKSVNFGIHEFFTVYCQLFSVLFNF